MAGEFVPLPRALQAALGLDEALWAAAMPRMCQAGLGLAKLIQQPVLQQGWWGSRHPSPPVNPLRCLTPERFCPANCSAAWWGARGDASCLLLLRAWAVPGDTPEGCGDWGTPGQHSALSEDSRWN